MSLAEEMLNTLAEGGETAVLETGEGYIVVNEDRTITVPESLRRLGVQYDHNIETVTFACPRFWDGNDMSPMKIYVNYIRPDGIMGQYFAENLKVEENLMYFDWVISNNVTKVKGQLSFLVCIVKTNEDGIEEQHWNSEINRQCHISEGMECSEYIVANYPDVITYILANLGGNSGGSGSGRNGSGVHVGPEPPEDTSLTWIDTDDDSDDVSPLDNYYTKGETENAIRTAMDAHYTKGETDKAIKNYVDTALGVIENGTY